MILMMTMVMMMVPAVVHPEHRLKHRRKRLFPEDDVSGPKIPRGDEVATSFGRELKVDPTRGGREARVVAEAELGHLNVRSDAAGGGKVGDRDLAGCFLHRSRLWGRFFARSCF